MKHTLLTFSIDNVEDVLNLVRTVAPYVEETVIVDSSNPREFDRLLGALQRERVRVYHVLPLGYQDPLRMYGLKKVKTEYVLYLDADERPSKSLLSGLDGLTEYSAYEMPRIDVRSGGVEHRHHLRVFRVADVTYLGFIHEKPVVRGLVCRLSTAYHFLHEYRGPIYYGAGERLFRYAQIEAIENPPTFVSLSRFFPFLWWLGALDTNRVIPSSLWYPMEFLLYLQSTWYVKSVTQATIASKYAVEVFKAFKHLSAEEQAESVSVATAMWNAGGPIAYLNLDDEAYVDALTDSFDWGVSGVDVFRRLVLYRYRHGVRAPSVPSRL